MTLTFQLNLDSVKIKRRGKYLGQMSFQMRSRRPHTHARARTHTHTTDRLLYLEVATPTPRPFSGRDCHALTWRSHGHSLAA